MKISFTLNGENVNIGVSPNTLLLELLRSLGMTSVKRGCETGECGACTILVDGTPRPSCITLAAQIDGRRVVTAEALSKRESLSPLQQSFADRGAAQCGYCTPAMLLLADEFLQREKSPGESEVREALSGVLCRCTGYVKPVEAISAVAGGPDEE